MSFYKHLIKISQQVGIGTGFNEQQKTQFYELINQGQIADNKKQELINLINTIDKRVAEGDMALDQAFEMIIDSIKQESVVSPDQNIPPQAAIVPKIPGQQEEDVITEDPDELLRTSDNFDDSYHQEVSVPGRSETNIYEKSVQSEAFSKAFDDILFQQIAISLPGLVRTILRDQSVTYQSLISAYGGSREDFTQAMNTAYWWAIWTALGVQFKKENDPRIPEESRGTRLFRDYRFVVFCEQIKTNPDSAMYIPNDETNTKEKMQSIILGNNAYDGARLIMSDDNMKAHALVAISRMINSGDKGFFNSVMRKAKNIAAKRVLEEVKGGSKERQMSVDEEGETRDIGESEANRRIEQSTLDVGQQHQIDSADKLIGAYRLAGPEVNTLSDNLVEKLREVADKQSGDKSRKAAYSRADYLQIKMFLANEQLKWLSDPFMRAQFLSRNPSKKSWWSTSVGVLKNFPEDSDMSKWTGKVDTRAIVSQEMLYRATAEVGFLKEKILNVFSKVNSPEETRRQLLEEYKQITEEDTKKYTELYRQGDRKAILDQGFQVMANKTCYHMLQDPSFVIATIASSKKLPHLIEEKYKSMDVYTIGKAGLSAEQINNILNHTAKHPNWITAQDDRNIYVRAMREKERKKFTEFLKNIGIDFDTIGINKKDLNPEKINDINNFLSTKKDIEIFETSNTINIIGLKGEARNSFARLLSDIGVHLLISPPKIKAAVQASLDISWQTISIIVLRILSKKWQEVKSLIESNPQAEQDLITKFNISRILLARMIGFYGDISRNLENNPHKGLSKLTGEATSLHQFYKVITGPLNNLVNWLEAIHTKDQEKQALSSFKMTYLTKLAILEENLNKFGLSLIWN